MNERFPLAWLVPLRLLMAAILLVEGWGKFRCGWFHGDALSRTTEAWLTAHRTFHFFLAVTKSAHEHPKVFGTLVTLGELFVGACLAVGAVTRLASLVGVLLLGSIAAASGQGLAPPGNAVVMAAVLATFVIVPPGRVFGLDTRLRTTLPRWMV